MKIKFISKWEEHRIVMSPSRKVLVGFEPVQSQGKSIQFKNGEFETDVQEEIDFLRSNSEFGTIIHEVPSVEDTKKGILEMAEKIKQAKQPATEDLKCECGFVAKSKLGLISHKKKCDEKK